MALSLKENNAQYVVFNLTDHNGNVVSLSSLGTFQINLYYLNSRITTSDRYHGRFINGRQAQNAKNANNVFVSATGSVTWYMQPEDNEKLDQSTERELHVVRFDWYYGLPDGSRGRNTNETFFYVESNAGNI